MVISAFANCIIPRLDQKIPTDKEDKGEMGRWGDGEMGRWGSGCISYL
ncbi:hypothetical protein BJP36_41505 [Moorena producens JHB]|uniref:Uncharacterized protein n=1 Tax=Moorena producens (strain JHB) TaxID=1454205 RepID=A0A9Q9UVH5_MOOP1|nr:hypothetical protein [Moorena producens]WAN68841.1 hypothetical protein BJP36_41505 [Moorena producens JHB]